VSTQEKKRRFIVDLSATVTRRLSGTHEGSNPEQVVIDVDRFGFGPSAHVRMKVSVITEVDGDDNEIGEWEVVGLCECCSKPILDSGDLEDRSYVSVEDGGWAHMTCATKVSFDSVDKRDAAGGP
jgi:hypothetical protein